MPCFDVVSNKLGRKPIDPNWESKQRPSDYQPRFQGLFFPSFGAKKGQGMKRDPRNEVVRLLARILKIRLRTSNRSVIGSIPSCEHSDFSELSRYKIEKFHLSLRSTPNLFSDFHANQVNETLPPFRFEAKRVIIRQGHKAENFYFILSGTGM